MNAKNLSRGFVALRSRKSFILLRMSETDPVLSFHLLILLISLIKAESEDRIDACIFQQQQVSCESKIEHTSSDVDQLICDLPYTRTTVRARATSYIVHTRCHHGFSLKTVKAEEIFLMSVSSSF